MSEGKKDSLEQSNPLLEGELAGEKSKVSSQGGVDWLNIVIAVLISTAVAFGSVYYYLGQQGIKTPPILISVDFEQGLLDAKQAGLKVDAADWLYKRVQSVCKGNKCVVFSGGVVIGGGVVDVNEQFRKIFSIPLAEKPKENFEDILEIFKGFDKKG